METYIDVFFVVRNVVFLSQSTEVPAFFAGREALFHHFPVYGNAECAFPVLLLPVPVQLVGNARIPAEDIGKEKLYFIYTLGSIEAITFYLIPEGLDKGPSAVFWISVCAVPSLPPMYPQLPAA